MYAQAQDPELQNWKRLVDCDQQTIVWASRCDLNRVRVLYVTHSGGFGLTHDSDIKLWTALIKYM